MIVIVVIELLKINAYLNVSIFIVISKIWTIWKCQILKQVLYIINSIKFEEITIVQLDIPVKIIWYLLNKLSLYYFRSL